MRFLSKMVLICVLSLTLNSYNIAEAIVCSNYVVCQDFEGNGSCSGYYCLSGVDNSEYWSKWDSSFGTAICDPNYSSSPLHLSESLRMSSMSGGPLTLVKNVWTSISTNEFYMFFELNMIHLPSSGVAPILGVWDGFDYQFDISALPDGKIRINHGTTSADSSTSISQSTHYYVWMYYSPGTWNNDGSCWVKISTSKTIPSSNFVSITGNGAGGSWTDIIFELTTNTYEYIIDRVLYKTSPIGSICE